MKKILIALTILNAIPAIAIGDCSTSNGVTPLIAYKTTTLSDGSEVLRLTGANDFQLDVPPEVVIKYSGGVSSLSLNPSEYFVYTSSSPTTDVDGYCSAISLEVRPLPSNKSAGGSKIRGGE